MALIYCRYLLFFAIFSFLLLCRATKEKTLAMIKPDGVEGNYSERIKKEVLASGFIIARETIVQLDEATARSFYAEHSSKSFFPNLIKYMTSGPVLIMILEKENAVADWRNLIGPTDAENAKITHPHSGIMDCIFFTKLACLFTPFVALISIRAICGISKERNCVHGSDSHQSASREISFFFDADGTTHDEL